MDDEAKKCEGCGKLYYPAGEWIHEGCGISDTGEIEVAVSAEVGPALPKDDSRWDSKQRRDKDKYNAYMRENRHKWKK